MNPPSKAVSAGDEQAIAASLAALAAFLGLQDSSELDGKATKRDYIMRSASEAAIVAPGENRPATAHVGVTQAASATPAPCSPASAISNATLAIMEAASVMTGTSTPASAEPAAAQAATALSTRQAAPTWKIPSQETVRRSAAMPAPTVPAVTDVATARPTAIELSTRAEGAEIAGAARSEIQSGAAPAGRVVSADSVLASSTLKLGNF